MIQEVNQFTVLEQRQGEWDLQMFTSTDAAAAMLEAKQDGLTRAFKLGGHSFRGRVLAFASMKPVGETVVCTATIRDDDNAPTASPKPWSIRDDGHGGSVAIVDANGGVVALMKSAGGRKRANAQAIAEAFAK